MNKRKKLIIFLFLLIILVLICRAILKADVIKYKLSYEKQTFEIKETYSDNYYIEIETDNNVYPVRIYKDLNNKRKIIDKIYYYSDGNYECILPIIQGELEIDFMCYKDNIIYNYNSLVGESNKLDKFVNDIKEYDKSKFEDNLNNVENINNTVKVYTNNNISNLVAITTYRGLIVNNEEINLFTDDVYTNKISTFINNYYIIADYETNYEFNYFYVINLENQEVFKLKSKTEISFDSYIQGIVDNKIYLYDMDNENQFEIDIDNREINIVSDDKYVKYYKNNKWEKLNKAKANKEVYFDYTSLDNNFTDYDEVKETTNYYYLFKEINNGYKLYRVDKNNTEVYKFIEIVPTVNITFKDNYLYYIDNNKLYYYNDMTGLKTLFEYSELEFNDTIKYYIY